jgi:hypothetical protein
MKLVEDELARNLMFYEIDRLKEEEPSYSLSKFIGNEFKDSKDIQFKIEGHWLVYEFYVDAKQDRVVISGSNIPGTLEFKTSIKETRIVEVRREVGRKFWKELVALNFRDLESSQITQEEFDKITIL